MHDPDFVGRTEIMVKIDAVLLPPSATNSGNSSVALRSYAICGYGGTGKTQIAIEYGVSRQAKFDAVFLVQAENPGVIAESFGQIAMQLGLVDTIDNTDHVVSRDVAMKWLSNPTKTATTEGEDLTAEYEKANWLIIFDNADDPNVLRDYWPPTNSGSVLITSRNPMAKSRMFQSTGIDIEGLPLDDAAKLLRNLASRDDSSRNVQGSLALAKRVGGLPLAISQMAALIQQWQMSFQEFLDYYEEQTKLTINSLSKLRLSHHPDQFQHSLLTVWAFEKLTMEGRLLLYIIAFFDADHIPEDVLTDDLPEDLPDDYPKSRPAYLQARTDLLASSLIKRNEEIREIEVHRLVQDVALAQMMSRNETFGYAVALVHRVWKQGDDIEFGHQAAPWVLQARLLPHALKILEFFEKMDESTLNIKVKRNLAQLFQLAGW
jgi:hypothetical protein